MAADVAALAGAVTAWLVLDVAALAGAGSRLFASALASVSASRRSSDSIRRSYACLICSISSRIFAISASCATAGQDNAITATKADETPLVIGFSWKRKKETQAAGITRRCELASGDGGRTPGRGRRKGKNDAGSARGRRSCLGCLCDESRGGGARQGAQDLRKGPVQSAQLVVKGSVVLSLLLLALLGRVPGCVRIRGLLREQQCEDAQPAEDSA
ncbi:MAG: hypothetical protein ACREUX_18165 [Burkholderiales bacterium]